MRLYDFKGPGDQLLVSLDYDNTYTADPKGMRALIRCLQSSGHKVIIVTMRSRELDWDAEFSFLKSDYGIETFFADAAKHHGTNLSANYNNVNQKNYNS